MHKKRISLNSVENFLSHSADRFRRRTLLCFERIPVSKIFKQSRGKLHSFAEIFPSHRTQKTSSGNHSVFHKICCREENFMDKRGGRRVSQFSVEKSLSHCTEMFHWGTLRCFRKFFYQKFPCIGGGGGASRFCRNLFLSHRTEKTSPGNHSVFHKISRREKVFMDKRGGGGITIFRRKVFVSLYQNISLQNTLVFDKNFFMENNHA